MNNSKCINNNYCKEYKDCESKSIIFDKDNLLNCEDALLKNRIKELEMELFIGQIENSGDKDKEIKRLEEKVLLIYDENKELKERCRKFDEDGVTLAMNLEVANNKIRNLQKELEEYKFVKNKWKKATNVVREKVKENRDLEIALKAQTKRAIDYCNKYHDAETELFLDRIQNNNNSEKEGLIKENKNLRNEVLKWQNISSQQNNIINMLLEK